MNILYTCDDNYVWLMGVSVISLFENNKNVDDITVYLLGYNITNKNINILNGIAKKYNREIKIINVQRLNVPESLISSRWPISAFTRLFAGTLLPLEIDTILYLDCDTIISGNIENLYSQKSDKPFYGVKDCISGKYKENIGLDKNDIYVNAGVLLIKLNELRKLDINKMLNEYIFKFEKNINYADQDILNGAFKGLIGVLNPIYNVMTIDTVYSYKDILVLRHPTNFYTKDEIECAVSNPHIIHYTTNMSIIRPWYSNSNHPFKSYFKKYLNISPWRDRETNVYKFNQMEYKIIKCIQILPSSLANCILGVIHSEIKPLFIKIKSRRRK